MTRTPLISTLPLLLAAGLAAQPRGPEPEPTYGEPLRRSVQFVQDVICESAGGEGWLADVEVHLPLPRSSGRQKVDALVIDPPPDARIRDRWGNDVGVWRRPRVDPEHPLRLGWRCRVELREERHRVPRDRLEPLGEVPEAIRKLYLGGGRKYGLDDPELKAAAAAAATDPRDAYDLAWQINEYVRRRLSYRNDGHWESAPAVLRNRHGSCSEYNFLFMALCRLNGLPARYVGASALRSEGPRYEDTVHHRWTEVWLPGYGWFPVDVSRNDGEEGRPVNGNFGRTSARLLVLMKGDGADDAPLAWSYVSAIRSRRVGDAQLLRPKRFEWRTGVTEEAAGN